MDASKYPFDFAAFKPGDVIEAETIERLKNCKRTDHDYHIKLMSIQQVVNDGIKQEQGRHLFVKCEGDCLRILHHEEASDYGSNICDLSLKRYKRTYFKLLDVDMTGFTEEQKALHLRRLQTKGAILAAVKDAKQKLRIEAPKRPTPGLIPTK